MIFCVTHSNGIISITNANTTVAYCRYDLSGTIEYLFVGPSFRRQGYATFMLDSVEALIGFALRFNPPISPLGRHVVSSYGQGRRLVNESNGKATTLEA